MAAQRKPVMSLDAARVWHRIIAYAKRYRHVSGILHHAASDVMDGWFAVGAEFGEARELVRRRLLKVVKDDCGTTWVLSPRAIRIIQQDTRP
jgi:hypothetical protein